MSMLEPPIKNEFTRLSQFRDEELLREMQGKNADALAILFDRYQRLVLSVAYRILKDLGEAEDVMEAVFFEIYRSAYRFDPSRGTVRTWILQYARHRSISRKRNLILRHHYTSVEIDAAEQEVLPNWKFPNEAELRRLMKQALETLTPKQQAVLQKAYFEGLSLKEIAAQTEDSFGNVRHHYYRGLAKLRNVLTEQDDDEDGGLAKGRVLDAET